MSTQQPNLPSSIPDPAVTTSSSRSSDTANQNMAADSNVAFETSSTNLRKRTTEEPEQMDVPTSEHGIPSSAALPMNSRKQSSRQGSPPLVIPPLRKTFTELFSPERKVGTAPGYMQSIKAVVFASWLNLLLVCVPSKSSVARVGAADCGSILCVALCESKGRQVD